MRGYWSPFAESPSPRHYGETANDDGRAAFEAARQALPAGPAGRRRQRGRRGISLWLRPGHHLSARARRQAGGRVVQGAGAMAPRRPARLGRRVDGNPVAPEQAELRDRLRGAAHHRPGLHDGLPGRRSARTGPRLRGRDLRVAGNVAHSRHLGLGKAAGQERSHPHGKALHRGAARRGAGDRLLHLPDLERLSRPVRQPGHGQHRHRQAASGRDPAAGHHREGGARSAGRSGLRPQRGAAGRACLRR